MSYFTLMNVVNSINMELIRGCGLILAPCVVYVI